MNKKLKQKLTNNLGILLIVLLVNCHKNDSTSSVGSSFVHVDVVLGDTNYDAAMMINYSRIENPALTRNKFSLLGPVVLFKDPKNEGFTMAKLSRIDKDGSWVTQAGLQLNSGSVYIFNDSDGSAAVLLDNFNPGEIEAFGKLSVQEFAELIVAKFKNNINGVR